MKQTIKGNIDFMKKTILPMTKDAGIMKVKITIIKPQLPDDKVGMEITFDTDKEKNAKLLALLKKKVGQKRSPKRKKMNLTVSKEQIKEIIREEIQSVLTEGTRWSVGIEAPSGKIASTYGHYDGYPEYAGKMLKRYYSNTGKVKQLMKLGKQGISTIDKSIKGGDDHSFGHPKKGETVFYGRDRGSKSSMSSTWRNRDKLKFNSGDEFAYIWSVKDKKWYYKSRYSNPQHWTELK